MFLVGASEAMCAYPAISRRRVSSSTTVIGMKLGVSDYLVVNDFGAVAHAVAAFDGAAYTHLCGPDEPLPESGMVTILGPGTGLGVAGLLLGPGGPQVNETEGRHIDFAPLDSLENRSWPSSARAFAGCRSSASCQVAG
jgi:glucokinase